MKRSIICFLAILIFGWTAMFAEIHGLPLGYIHKTNVEYLSETTVTVTAGTGECNDFDWKSDAAASVDLSGVMPGGEDFIYIYVDHSACDYPAPAFTGTTTEPVWSPAKMGWYNGEDRCIGVVFVNSSGNIAEFSTNPSDECVYQGGLKKVLTNGNPDQTYKFLECSAYVPVNASSLYVSARNSATSGTACVIVAANQNIRARIAAKSKMCTVITTGWIPLQRELDRNLQWYGPDKNDNNYQIHIFGYRVDR